MSANIDILGVLSADWISGHGDSRQIVFLDIGPNLLSETENLKDSTAVHALLSSFTECYVFNFRSRKSDGILSVGQLIGPPLNMRTKPV